MFNPEIGFASDMILDLERLVSPTELIHDCIRTTNLIISIQGGYFAFQI